MMNNFTLITDAENFAFSAENPDGRPGGGTAGINEKLRPCITVQPGETATLCEVDGEGCLQHFWFGGKISHSFILRIYWDGQENPSVEAPLSAFFGWAYDENYADTDGSYTCLNSAVMLVSPAQGCNVWFPMPFRKHCLVTLENRGRSAMNTYYTISGVKAKQPENIGYFHASYRQAHPVPKDETYTALDGIDGKGQLVGLTLASGLNGANGCWVEGEVRMYIDGEKTPSLHYTGTEDYFGGSYAFGYDNRLHKYQTYSGAYMGMYAVLGGNIDEYYKNQLRFLLYRWHLNDPIHFSKSLRITMDNHGGVKRYDDYTTVAYWYQTLPTAEFPPLPPDDEMNMN